MFGIVAGRPKTSLPETYPDYTMVQNEDLNDLTTILFSYRRYFNKVSFGMEFLNTLNSGNSDISFFSIDSRYTFSPSFFEIAPVFGFQKFKIKGTNELDGAFKLTPYSQPYLGLSIKVLPHFAKNSSFLLEFSSSGFFESSRLRNFQVVYEYLMSSNIGFSLGFYNIQVEGTWRPEDNYTDKRTIREEYSGLKLSLNFSF